jgi:hypothetical protein
MGTGRMCCEITNRIVRAKVYKLCLKSLIVTITCAMLLIHDCNSSHYNLPRTEPLTTRKGRTGSAWTQSVRGRLKTEPTIIIITLILIITWIDYVHLDYNNHPTCGISNNVILPFCDVDMCIVPMYIIIYI